MGLFLPSANVLSSRIFISLFLLTILFEISFQQQYQQTQKLETAEKLNETKSHWNNLTSGLRSEKFEIKGKFYGGLLS